MLTSVIRYLEETASKYPDKIAYWDINKGISFHTLLQSSRAIGTAIAKNTEAQKPVVVFMEKGAHNISAFMGAAYARDYYVPIDKNMPVARIKMICDILKPSIILYDNSTLTAARELWKEEDIVLLGIEEAKAETIDHPLLERMQRHSKTTDLLYVLFTSGSTGVPKGVTISHAAVIDFIEWLCEKYDLNQNTALCNQAPFYFDASVPDIFIPIKTGATVFIPPSNYYTYPKKVLQFIKEHEINTLIWVPSALCNVVNCRAFDVCVPTCVRLVIFCGEVMPCRHLNIWKKYMPGAHYVNMYGPTEATYACTYYDIDRDFADDEKLPLGRPCENCDILLITEEGTIAATKEIGEICILGVCLSNGYYGNTRQTTESFVQNPLQDKWLDTMYKTGDLAYWDDSGNLIFSGRKDFQIKRLGHRIELGEIENALLSNKNIDQACCVFQEATNDVIAVYSGDIDEIASKNWLENRIPSYMLPNRYVRMDSLPMNLNGKIDRIELTKVFSKGV